MRSLKLGETVWDAAVTGFAARRQKGDAIAYVLKYRTAEGRQRWHTIGRHGAPWTPDKAREEAQRLLGEVAKGGDPAADKKALRKAATVAELCDLYLTEALEGRVLKRSGAKEIDHIGNRQGPHRAAHKAALGNVRHHCRDTARRRAVSTRCRWG